MDHFKNVNPSAARTYYVEPQHEDAGQAGFEQRLRETQPIHRTSALPGAGSPPTVTEGNRRALAIQGNERCAAASFVRTRGQLAATLTCANVGALRGEIELAAQQSARWQAATGTSAGSVDPSRVFDDVVASSYAELQRFQNHATHCKPRVLGRQSAMDHLRSMASLRYAAAPWNIWGGQQLDLARAAAEHMRGDTSFSPFVSLSEDASRLLLSPEMPTSMARKQSRKTRMSCTPTRCRRRPLGRPKRSSGSLRTGLKMMNQTWPGWAIPQLRSARYCFWAGIWMTIGPLARRIHTGSWRQKDECRRSGKQVADDESDDRTNPG